MNTGSQPFLALSLHPDAPPKPDWGAACNGCGVCCAAETCPVARLRFLRRHGPCPALRWSVESGCYRCGLLSTPDQFFPLPVRLRGVAGRVIARWIASGAGCDCSMTVLPETAGECDGQ